MTDASTDSIFAIRLREARRRQGLTQAELAQRAEMQPSAIAHFEASRRMPSFENLRRLAKTLDVSSDYLMGFNTAIAFRNEEKLTQSDRDYVQELIDQLVGEAKI